MRSKRRRPDVQKFEYNLEKNIFELRDQLTSGEYRHGSYEPFIIHDPKRRQIHKASVKDRLVHQAVTDIIEPFFDRQFIFDSFSCRKGKGTHAGIKRLQKFLRSCSANNTKTVYGLKLDVHQFFASVDHQVLLDLLSIKIKDDAMTGLLIEIINSFSTKPGKGIPLGNVTSQLFANIYLHGLDCFVKHNLREKYFVRYCDNFVIVSTKRQHLLQLIDPIGRFLNERLALEVHPNKITIRSWYQGIDFLGYVIKPHCILLRPKTQKRMIKKVNPSNLSSYLGLCSHASSYELQQFIRTKVWLEGEHTT